MAPSAMKNRSPEGLRRQVVKHTLQGSFGTLSMEGTPNSAGQRGLALGTRNQALALIPAFRRQSCSICRERHMLISEAGVCLLH